MGKEITNSSDLDIIRTVGIAKEDDANERAHDTVMDYMARSVMRAPSHEAQQIITKTKDKLKIFFQDCSEEEINWLFSHGMESRGFFQSHLGHKSQKEALFTWLNRPSTTSWFADSSLADTTSMDISLINGIVASISYAAFDHQTNYEKVDENGVISIHDCYQIQNKCAALMAHSPYVGSYLPERNQAIVKERGREKRLAQSDSFDDTTGQIAPAPRRFVSMASADSEASYASTIPSVEATRRLFNMDTVYVNLAKSKGRLVGHYSANTTSALFILNELFKLGESSHTKQLSCVLSEEEAKIFAGLVAAEYHRSGFHSPEEVYLGTQPYLERLKLGLSELKKSEFEVHLEHVIPKLIPQNEEAFTALTKHAIEMMGDASILKVREAIHSLSDAIAIEPSAKMLEEEPISLVEQKQINSKIFKSFKGEYQDGVNKIKENDENINHENTKKYMSKK